MSLIKYSKDDWAIMRDQAEILSRSGMLPQELAGHPGKVIAIMMKGRELGLPPMQSFTSINIIKGKPTQSAESMLAMIYKMYPSTVLKYLKNDKQACVIEVEKNSHTNTFSFTIEDAKDAGLLGKQNWKLYTRAMLRSRCISEMARSLFPEALCGISYTPDEIDATSEQAEIKVVEQKPEEKPEEKPLANVEEEYNPDNESHRSIIRSIFKKHSVLEKDNCKRFSDYCYNSKTKIKDLDARLSEIIKAHIEEG